jgi:protein-tyrosine phosphatase
VDRLRRSPTYADDINSKDARSHRPRPETMAAFLDQVDARHGGVTAWLAGQGFGAEDVSLLAARLRRP